MNKTVWCAAGAALVLAFVPVAVSIAQEGSYTPPPSHPSLDQSQQQHHQSSTTTSTGQKVRPEIAKPLQEALKLDQAQDYAGAMAKIREADAVSGKTPDEEYVIAKFMGSVALKLNDHATALTAFNRAIASGAVPDAEKPNMLYIDMVLNAEQKNFAQAITLGEQLQALGPLDEKAAVALAQSYYNKGDYQKALQVAQAALAKGVQDPTIKAELLEVQTKGQAQMGNTSGAVASLEQQCAAKCDGHTWGQLVSITMGNVHGLTDHLALNLFRLKMLAGGMEKDDYTTMATVALSLGLSAETKAVLEKGIASGAISRSGNVAALLAKATPLAAADARSLPAFEKEAAAKSTGEEDIKLGESYYTHGQYAQAETALRRGLGKPGVRDRADAQVTLGIVLLAEGKKADAIAAFNQAGGSTAQKPVAHLWTVYANAQH